MVNANDAIGQTFMLHKRTWSGAHRLIIAGRASLDQEKNKKSKPNQKEKKKVYYFLVMLFGLWLWRGCWSHLRMGSISIKHYVVVVWSLGSRPDGVSIAAAPSLYEKRKMLLFAAAVGRAAAAPTRVVQHFGLVWPAIEGQNNRFI